MKTATNNACEMPVVDVRFFRCCLFRCLFVPVSVCFVVAIAITIVVAAIVVVVVNNCRSMTMHKVGWWRQYYENGNVKSEMQYKDGVRIGFCKRYAPDGAVAWVKDYTKEYMQRVNEFNEKKGKVAFTILESCSILGLDGLPPSMKEVNSQYRVRCAPVHPDKSPDPDATEEFLKLSRARDTLKAYFEKHDSN